MSGVKQVIIDVVQLKDIDAENVAEFLTAAANNYDATRKLITHMADALEKCLTCKGITWEVEHDGDIMVRRARAFLEG